MMDVAAEAVSKIAKSLYVGNVPTSMMYDVTLLAFPDQDNVTVVPLTEADRFVGAAIAAVAAAEEAENLDVAPSWAGHGPPTGTPNGVPSSCGARIHDQLTLVGGAFDAVAIVETVDV
jgi:hypothetical protein